MRRIDLPIIALEYICVTMLGAGWAPAQDRPSAGQEVVVASVDGEPIYLSEVDRILAKVARKQEVNPAARPVLRAQVLAEIVDRRLVLAYAKRRKSGATPAEVDAALAKLKSQLKRQGSSLERFLQQQSITEADLRRQLTWNLAWEKYLARYVTEARLQSHFKTHRREFDGTRLSVSHILLRPKADGDPRAMADLVKQAQAIRREITSGNLSFAEAAAKYSAAPSAKDGGRLGLIARRGAMVESFSQAAFALEVGQLSRPVTTRFGVHLIRCDQIKPGNKKWTDVREQLQKALARELLDRLARIQQPHTPVKFTGRAPYFKPGTRELVLP
jgi:parvulin-like peptidyl-prolyl isomerase